MAHKNKVGTVGTARAVKKAHRKRDLPPEVLVRVTSAVHVAAVTDVKVTPKGKLTYSKEIKDVLYGALNDPMQDIKR